MRMNSMQMMMEQMMQHDQMISPAPQAVELQITRPGESTPRSFRWQLK